MVRGPRTLNSYGRSASWCGIFATFRPASGRVQEPDSAFPRLEFSSLKFLAEIVVDRPAAAALEHDRKAKRRPQQWEFVAAIGPEVSTGPLKDDHDHDHLHKDHRGGEAREQADCEAS